MRKFCWMIALAALAGCATGPAGPTLPSTLLSPDAEFEDTGGVLPIHGVLQLKIETDGMGTSTVAREIWTNIDRRSALSGDQLQQVHRLVEAWVAGGKEGPNVGAKPFASISYEGKKFGWAKDAALPDALNALVAYLRTIPPTLSLSGRRK